MKRFGNCNYIPLTFILFVLYSCVSADLLPKVDLKFVDDTGIRNHLRTDGFYITNSRNYYYEGAFVFYKEGGILALKESRLEALIDSLPSTKIIKMFVNMGECGVFSVKGDTMLMNIYTKPWRRINGMTRTEARIVDSTHFIILKREYYVEDSLKTGERVFEQPYHFIPYDSLPPSHLMYIKEKEVLWDDKYEYISFMNKHGKKIKHKKE